MRFFTSFFVIVTAKLVLSSQCNGGYFSEEHKKCINCPEHCQLCDSSTKCLYCEDGYWGNICENPCSMCQPKTRCAKPNGFCIDKCKDGYTGSLCDAFCNDKCLNCDKMNASLCDLCALGRYGESCDRRCPGFCDNNACDNSGYCTYGCDSGYWGPKCENNCSGNCNHGSCDTQTGACTYGCKINFFGSSCDKRCPEFCDKNTCNDSGYCTYGCNSGYWGPKCGNNCSSNCKHSSCETQTGACTYGCKSYFFGSSCDKRCPAFCNNHTCNNSGYCTNGCNSGYWGPRCENSCSSNCKHSSCDTQTGACTNGCPSNFVGSKCESGKKGEEYDEKAANNEEEGHTANNDKENEASRQGGEIWPVILIVVAVLIVIVSVVVGVVYRKKLISLRRRGPTPEAEAEAPIDIPLIQTRVLRTSEDSGVCSQESMPACLTQNTAKLLQPGTTLDTNNEVRNDQLEKIMIIPEFLADKIEAALSLGPGLLQQDKAATIEAPSIAGEKAPSPSVKIRTESAKSSDGENATGLDNDSHSEASLSLELLSVRHIPDFSGEKAYIICKDPTSKSETHTVFWNMVWKKGCNIIVKLSRVIEETPERRYWPDDKAEHKYGDVIVTSQGVMSYDEYRRRTFVITMENKPRVVEQMQFTKWPIDRLPADKESLINFLKEVHKLKKTSHGPLLAHCSDGFSRSCVFIALDMILGELEKQNHDDIGNILIKLQDKCLITTTEQCEFLCKIWDILRKEIDKKKP